MKKNILAIAAAIMVVGTITFVACNKDSDTNQIVNPSYVSAKGGSTLNQLRNVMVAYYAACDSTYQADSTSFLSVCANNDTVNFLNVTGISRDMLCAYQILALSENEDYIHNHPDLIKEVSACSECQEYALSRLGELASQTQGHMSALVPDNISEINRDQLNRIIYACRSNNSHVMTACISANMREMARELLTKYLNVFWQHCDYAYVHSPDLLETACEKEDFNQFCSIINLPERVFDEIIGLANVSYIDFIQNNPNYVFDVDTCKTCSQSSLYELWNNIVDLHNVIGEINDIAPDYFDSIMYTVAPVDECLYRCKYLFHYSDRALVTCYEDCMLGKFSVKYEQVLMLLKHDAGIID